MTLHADEVAELARKEMLAQEVEITNNYIAAKERLANCVSFGNKKTCGYKAKGLPETCISCENYKSESTLKKDINKSVVLTDIILSSRED